MPDLNPGPLDAPEVCCTTSELPHLNYCLKETTYIRTLQFFLTGRMQSLGQIGCIEMAYGQEAVVQISDSIGGITKITHFLNSP